ncbi:hypothetical protein BKA69DRAFT_718776 [Paraphysoderma sedebokerense]|nr:hypothetical protein BKA69DRAFT_718776 [Paraphysoderma sedebokerense]
MVYQVIQTLIFSNSFNLVISACKKAYVQPHLFNGLRVACALTATIAIMGELIKAFPANESGLIFQHLSLTLCWYVSFIIRAVYIFKILHKISISESERRLCLAAGGTALMMYATILIFWFATVKRYINATGFPSVVIPDYGFILDLVFTLILELLIIASTAKIVKMEISPTQATQTGADGFFKSAKALQFFKYMVVQACLVSVVIVTINLYNYFLYDFSVSNHLYSLQMYILPFSLAVFEALLKDSNRPTGTGGKGPTSSTALESGGRSVKA